MKKQENSSSKDKMGPTKGPTCGDCIHNPSGHRCCIHPDWPVLPDDPISLCEFYFHRVPKEYMKYYKHKPMAPKGWLWDPQIFSKMMQDLWEYIEDIRKGIISDNNGGYFTRYPFGNKLT